MEMPRYFKIKINPTSKEIEAVPIFSEDVVEVVRCEDCKYWGVYDEPIKHCMRGMLKLPVHGYEFCCRGERKETE